MIHLQIGHSSVCHEQSSKGGRTWFGMTKNLQFSFFWASCSFKGSRAAIINDSHCSSAPTAAFTIQMELSQKGNETQSYILGL